MTSFLLNMMSFFANFDIKLIFNEENLIEITTFFIKKTSFNRVLNDKIHYKNCITHKQALDI